MSPRAGWVLLLTAIVVCCGVLGLYPSHAAPTGGGQPVANPAEQRMEMIAELKEIKALLKEQNALLQSGSLKVVVAESEKR